MEIVVTVAAIMAMIMLGVLLIHGLNVRHNQRIAASHYSDVLPGIGRRSRKTRQSVGLQDLPAAPLTANPATGTANDVGLPSRWRRWGVRDGLMPIVTSF
ncbi:hypothetical protein GCM10023080_017160 [Streptomyces pseudoechinosporeus]